MKKESIRTGWPATLLNLFKYPPAYPRSFLANDKREVYAYKYNWQKEVHPLIHVFAIPLHSFILTFSAPVASHLLAGNGSVKWFSIFFKTGMIKGKLGTEIDLTLGNSNPCFFYPIALKPNPLF